MAKAKFGTIEGTSDIRAMEGLWLFDDDDWALIAMLQDAVYMAELLFEDPLNREYAGCYKVRAHQYPLFRPVGTYTSYPCARDVGKTESIKARACVHAFKRLGEDLLLTAPELIHLEPLTQAVEARITEVRLLRDFLKRDNQKTGFTHKPFQCVEENQLVLTARGHVPIRDVEVGDEVLTHMGRWRRVQRVWDNGLQEVSMISASGCAGLVATGSHKLYARSVRQREGRGATGKRRMYWELRDPEWVALKHWRTQQPAHRLALPSAVAVRPTPEPFRLNRSGFGVGNGPEIAPLSPEFLWLLGLYLAEGCTWRGKLTIFTVHEDEAAEVRGRLEAIGATVQPVPNTGRSVGLRISNQPLAQFFEREAPGSARTKDMPTWVYGLSVGQRSAVLDGLLYGDGHLRPDGSWHGSFASRALMQSVVVLAHGLGWAAGAGWVDAKRNVMASGHVIDAGEQWAFYVNPEPERSHVHVKFDDGLAWAAATRLTPVGRARVFDLTVEEDHSYVASGVVVSNCDFVDGTRIIGRIPKITGTGVKGQHVADLIIEEAQDYPDAGWIEVFPTVLKDHTGPDGEYDFSMSFYGVHAMGQGGRFATLSQSAAYKVTTISRLMHSGWNKQEKAATVAMYGGSNTPDYRRNVLGESGGSLSAFFVTARLMACIDQEPDSRYNTATFKAQEFHAEELDKIVPMPSAKDRETWEAYGQQVASMFDLPETLGQQVYGGMDVGLVNDPTVIMLFAVLPDERKRLRLSLVRMFHLWRFREKQIRLITYIIARRYGLTLRAFGQDVTGLGLPLYQAMEDDEECPEHLKEASQGYVFNAKVPVAVDKDYVSEQGGRLVDQYGNMVEEVRDKWTGRTYLVARMTMIEASTRYLRRFVDDTYLRLPFHEGLFKDFQGETEQRVKAMAGMKKKPSAFHMLDAARAFAMAYKQGEMEEQVYSAPQVPVMDRAVAVPASWS